MPETGAEVGGGIHFAASERLLGVVDGGELRQGG
jgi:hypothetical protein